MGFDLIDGIYGAVGSIVKVGGDIAGETVSAIGHFPDTLKNLPDTWSKGTGAIANLATVSFQQY